MWEWGNESWPAKEEPGPRGSARLELGCVSGGVWGLVLVEVEREGDLGWAGQGAGSLRPVRPKMGLARGLLGLLFLVVHLLLKPLFLWGVSP